MRLTRWTLASRSHRIIAGLWMIAATGAAAQGLPKLEINSPFAGTTQSLDSDSSGNYLVTTNTARALIVWTKAGEKSWQPTIIRAPLRDEFVSAAYLGAITPDGKYLAFGVPPLSNQKDGYQAGTARIYILNQADGHLVTTLSAGIPTKLMKLRFSAGGEYLGAILGNGCGYRIWTRDQWTSSAQDQAPKWADDRGYADEAGTTKCSGDDNSAALPNGTDIVFTGHSEPGAPWLLTLNDNGFRSYTKSGDEIVQSGYLPRSALSLTTPHTIAMTGDIEGIAIGDNWGARLAILQRTGVNYAFSRNLAFAPEQLNTLGKDGDAHGDIYLPNPVWVQKNGKALIYAFGYFQPYNLANSDPSDAANSIVVFDPVSNDAKIIKLHDDNDSTLQALHRRNGSADSIFFVSTKQLSVLDVAMDSAAASAVLPIAAKHSLDLRGELPRFGLPLNKNGKDFYLPTLEGDNKYRTAHFDYGAMNLIEARGFENTLDFEKAAEAYSPSSGYYDAVSSPDEWGFERRLLADPVPTFFGHPISTENINRNEVAYSGATVPGRAQVIWGTDRMLRVVNADAKFDCMRPIESPAWRINITNDGRMVIVAHGDGVVRWYRLETTAEKCLPVVASLYLTQSNEGNWGFLAWLPNGKFMTGGGAGSRSIACYPVAKPDGLTSCVDFQQTEKLYDRDAVIRALTEASSDEGAPPDPHIQDALAKVLLQETLSVQLNGDTSTVVANYPVTAAIGDWKEGTRYLKFSANAGIDLSFTYKGSVYNSSKPLPLSAPGNFDLVLSLPDNLHHRAADIVVCPLVYSRILSDGSVDTDSRRNLVSNRLCQNISWRGTESRQAKKRKLWALLVGFSGSSHLATPALQYAHEDVLNFARFLELVSKHQLPDEEGGAAAPSYFDDMRIRLLVANPTVFPDNDRIKAYPKIDRLQNELGDDQFKVVYPQPGDTYNALVGGAVRDILSDINKFSSDHRNDSVAWEHKIVIYFSGHGFALKNEDNPDRPYMRMGLVTPDSQNDLERGSVWLDEVLEKLLRSQYFSLVIIDACRAAPGQPGSQPLDADYADVALYPDLNSNTQKEMHILYSSDIGHYSYEYPKYGVEDFAPKLTLWPPELATKGGGLFSLGLLASLVCEEALEYDPDFTLKNTDLFFRKYFFTGANPKWKSIEADLSDGMKNQNLQFYPPLTKYDPLGTKPPVLRERLDKMPHCFPTTGQ